MNKQSFIYKNSLSLVFLLLFIISFVGQFYTGLSEYNHEREEDKFAAVTASQYLKSGHFISATFENWESEFLQMALFVILTRTLRQKGSSESKKLEGKEEVDEDPDPKKKDAPWPVHKGGLALAFYKHSLTIILLVLYLFSFAMHIYGSRLEYNTEQLRKGEPTESLGEFLGSSKIWFESFQNWQSEFLSIVAIVILSIYFRQQGSPQSKPVDAPHSETGE